MIDGKIGVTGVSVTERFVAKTPPQLAAMIGPFREQVGELDMVRMATGVDKTKLVDGSLDSA
jgi:hypothetical protein